jgi:succinyl-diaminopimelate desuccinylase
MDRAAQVREWLDAQADEMTTLLARLVSINTENPPGQGLEECGAVLVEAMEKLEMNPAVHEVSDSRLDGARVVQGTCGDGERIVYFHGHFDVVPAQSPDQFKPRRENGRLIGRGAADMKGGLVSMLYGAAAARDLGILGDARVIFHSVCDEETGSAVGSGHLVDAGMIDPKAIAMVTAEPTGGVIWNSCRGAITARVTVAGQEAHVGLAHQGENAFDRMLQVAAPVVELAKQLLEERTELPADSDEARGSMMVVGGGIGSGANFNVVPGSAWFSVDWRFNPERTLENELQRLSDTIETAAASADAEVTIEFLQRQPSGSTDRSDPRGRALATCVQAVEGSQPRFQICPGVLETHWYSQLQIPAFGYGGGRLDVSHGPNEFIDLDAMRRCAAVYALYPRTVTQ